MAQHDRGPMFRPRIAIGRVRGNLLVPCVDETDAAVRELRQHGDVGVTAKTEHVFDVAVLEIFDELFRYQCFHRFTLVLRYPDGGAPRPCIDTECSSASAP